MKINEDKVVNAVKLFLNRKGYKVKYKKDKTSHGVDIKTDYHKQYRKQYLIEAKGEGGIKSYSACPVKHNSFYYLIGQIISRMDIEGNKPNRGRIYALAIPKKWELTFKNKIKSMKFGWRSLGLVVFLVDEKGKAELKPNRYFLK